ncbi:MAG TPA: hypothetical protein VIJ70_07375 [Gaiellaceae bacterium]
MLLVRIPIPALLHPAPPAELTTGSLTGWFLLAMVLALVLACGLVLASRR